MLSPFFYGVYCGAFLMIVLWALWQCARAISLERHRGNWLATVGDRPAGDQRVLRYVAKHGMTESDFYKLPLPEQRRRIGLPGGSNPGPASFWKAPEITLPPMPTELELDSIMKRRPNGGIE